MMRILKVFGLGIALLLVLCLLALAWLTRTDSGQRVLLSRLEPTLASVVATQLKSTLTIETIDGSPPGDLVVRGVSFSQDGKVWLTIDSMVLDWTAWSLVRGHINIREFALQDVALTRLPDLPDKDPAPEPATGLPDLPHITVRTLEIDGFSLAEGLVGPAMDLSLQGRASLDDWRWDVELSGAEENSGDTFSLTTRHDGRDISIDAKVSGQEDGAIAQLARIEGPLRLSISSSGPASDWTAALSLEAPALVNGSVELTGDVQALPKADVQIVGTFQPKLSLDEVPEALLGKEVSASTRLVHDGDLTRLSGLQLDAGGMTLSGDITFEANRPLQSLGAELDLTLTAAVAETVGLPEIAGRHDISADFAGDKRLAINTPLGSVQANNIQMTDGLYQTEIRIDAPQIPARFAVAPLSPTDQMQTTGQLIVDLLGDAPSIALKDVTGSLASATGDRQVELGSGLVDYRGGRLSGRGTSTITPGFLARLVPSLSADNDLSANVDLEGTTDLFAVGLTAELPAGRYGETSFPQGTLQTTLSDLPARPAGNILLRSQDGTYGATVRLSSPAPDVIGIEQAVLEFGQALGTASGRVNRATGAMTMDLQASLPSGTRLPQLGAVSGELTASLRRGADGSLKASLDLADIARETLTLEAAEVRLAGTSDRMTHSIKLSDLMIAGQRVTSATLSGQTQLTGQGSQTTIDTFRADLDRDLTVSLVRPAIVSVDDGDVTLSETRLDIGQQGQAAFSGRYTDTELQASLVLDDLRTPYLDAPVMGELTIDTGQPVPGQMALVATSPVAGAQFGLNGRWDGQQVQLTGGFQTEQSAEDEAIRISLPFRLAQIRPLQIDLGSQDLSGRIAIDETVATLARFVPVDIDSVTGRMVIDIDIGGSLTRPDLTGDIRTVDVQIEHAPTGLILRRINGGLDLSYGANGTQGAFRFTGQDLEGDADALELSGEVSLRNLEADRRSTITGSLVLEDALLIDNTDQSAKLSADLTLSGRLREMLLAGSIRINRLNTTIPSFDGRETYRTLNIIEVGTTEDNLAKVGQTTNTSPAIVNLDLSVRADDKVFLQGRGLDSEWAANIAVTGTLSDPVLRGSVTAVRGILNFAGRQFDLGESALRFSEAGGLLPKLDIRARTDVTIEGETVEAGVDITGSTEQPEIALTSSPAQPEEDVMAYILFGKKPENLSVVESLRIAEALARLGGSSPLGGGGLDSQLRTATGLDSVNLVRDGQTGANALEIGKYVADDIYISATQALDGTGNEITVTYEVNPRFTLETTIEPEGNQSVSANYKQDY